jgi:hypothetical protein
MICSRGFSSRERFLQTLRRQPVDRPPLFEEGMRDEVYQCWGLTQEDLRQQFHYDLREEIEINIDPRPWPKQWPLTWQELPGFQHRFRIGEHRRLPGKGKQWKRRLRDWKHRQQPLILRVQRGFFLSMGVEAWDTFDDVIYLTKDDPHLVFEILRIQGDLAAELAERVLKQVKVDAVLFSEPIGGNDRPLLSPKMYQELVLESYRPLMQVCDRFGVDLRIMRTYANPRPLLDAMFEFGFNVLWACETPPDLLGAANPMDYVNLRRDYGADLGLIGGMDADVLRPDNWMVDRNASSIQKELQRAQELLEQGGYIPLLDGRVREDVPYDVYHNYRNHLEAIVGIG